MLLEYVAIAILIILATGFAGLVVIIGHLFGPHREDTMRFIPYESGIDPIGPGTRQTPIHFYRIAVLFILFDIEVIFFLPWAVVFKQLGVFGLIEMFVFIFILLVGYVYAWKKGALEWE